MILHFGRENCFMRCCFFAPLFFISIWCMHFRLLRSVPLLHKFQLAPPSLWKETFRPFKLHGAGPACAYLWRTFARAALELNDSPCIFDAKVICIPDVREAKSKKVAFLYGFFHSYGGKAAFHCSLLLFNLKLWAFVHELALLAQNGSGISQVVGW